MTTDSPQISDREREILQLVAMGATNQQIAHQLHISINTVKVHLRNIFEKIGVASRTEATVYAIRQGLVEIEDALREDDAANDRASVAVSSVPDRSESVTSVAIEAPTTIETPPLPVATDVVAVPATHTTQRPRLQSQWLLLIFVGLTLLLGAAVVYLLVQQRTAAPAETPQTSAGLSQTSRWRSYAAWPQPREHAAIAVYDGRFYAIGGASADKPSGAVDRFDPALNQWVPLNEKPTPVSDVQAVTLGGRILVPGGTGTNGQALTAFEAYDPRTKTWQTLPPLPEPRTRYALADFEGKMLLFGGWDGSQFRNDVFEYDPASQQWRTKTAMPTARADCAAATVEGRISVVGGTNEQGSLPTNERFDPNGSNGGTWEIGVPLGAAIAAPAAVGVGTSVMVFDPEMHSATQYDIAGDVWSDSVAIPSAVGVSSRAVATTTKIFLFGKTSGTIPGSVYEYQTIFNTFLPGINSGQPPSQ